MYNVVLRRASFPAFPASAITMGIRSTVRTFGPPLGALVMIALRQSWSYTGNNEREGRRKLSTESPYSIFLPAQQRISMFCDVCDAILHSRVQPYTWSLRGNIAFFNHHVDLSSLRKAVLQDCYLCSRLTSRRNAEEKMRLWQ